MHTLQHTMHHDHHRHHLLLAAAFQVHLSSPVSHLIFFFFHLFRVRTFRDKKHRFLRARCTCCHPTNCVKALQETRTSNKVTTGKDLCSVKVKQHVKYLGQRSSSSKLSFGQTGTHRTDCFTRTTKVGGDNLSTC